MANDIKQIGVEIVATDKASGAFDSVNTSVDKLTESLKENDRQVKENAKSRSQSAEQNKRSISEEVSAQKAAREAAKEAAAAQEKLERSFTKRLQRQKEALILQDEGNVALLKAKGITNETLLSEAAALDVVIAKRREAAAVFTQSGRQLNEFGQTARQTAAALRQVPAQFTDIVVSLQGGQAPLTVLLQQGGQLKDVFGGVGNAAKAMSGYVLGLINPFTVAAATVTALGFAYKKGADEADAFAKSLILTGNAAGTTADELGMMAANVGRMVGGQAKAAEFMNLLVQSGNVASGSFERLTASALAFSEAGGGAIQDIAKKFAELGKSPVEASLKLTESAGYLTAATYEQIKALSDQGREIEAAQVAQEAYAQSLDNATPQMLARLGAVEKGWNLIKSAVEAAKNGLLGIGRDSALADITAQLANAYSTGATEYEIAWLEARYKKVKAIFDKEKEIAEIKKQGNFANEQKILFLKEEDKYLTNQQKFDKEKLRIQNAYNEALKNGLITQARIDALIENARKSILGKDEAKELKDQEKAAKELAATFAALSGLSSTYYEDLAKYQKQRQAGVITEAKYAKAVELLIQKQPFAIEQAKAAADADKERTKARDELNKSLSKGFADREKETAQLQKSLDQKKLELASIGETKTATKDLAAAKLELAAAEKEAYAAALENAVFAGAAGNMGGVYFEAANAAREQARILRETASTERQIGIAKDAEKAAAEWKKAAEKIESSITDALMRGFESGKGFIQTLRDTIVNTFKTMVLRPTVQAIVGAGLGAVGMNAQAGTGGGGGGLGYASGMGMGWLTDFGGSTAFATDAIGEFLVKNTSGPLNEFGSSLLENANTIGDYASTLGDAVGYLQAASYLMGDTKDYGAAAGSAIGTYFGGPIGGFIGGKLGEMFGLTDSSGTPHMGGAAGYSASGGLIGQSAAGQQLNFNVQANKATQMMVEGLSQSLAALFDTTAAIFGEKAGYYAATAFADDTSKDGAWGALMVKLGDQILIDWGKGADKWPGREFANGKQGATDYLGAVATDVRDVLRNAAPQWAQSMLDGLGDAPTLESLITTAKEIGRVQNTLVSMGKILPQLADLSGEAASALLAMSGGIDNLNKMTGSFYQNFYSEAERTAKTTELLTAEFAKFGQGLPDSRAAFRQLVEAQDLTTESGRAVYVALMSLADGFVSITHEVEGFNTSIRDAADRLAATNASLTDRLDLLTGAQTNRSLELRDALDDTSRAILEQIYAQEDLMAASAAAAAASRARKEAAAARTKEQAEAAKEQVDAAFSAVQRAIGAQRKIAEAAVEAADEQIKAVKSVFDVLTQSIKQLQGGSGSTARAASIAGQQFIQQSLSSARATGYLPESTQLSEAISDVIVGLDPANYQTSFALERDRLVLAEQLGQLKNLSGDQLTASEQLLKVAEDTVSALDIQLTTAQDQLNALRNIDTSIQTIPDALMAFAAAIDRTVSSQSPKLANNKRYKNRAVASRLPEFASGGLYGGGLALVGEKGPEIINFKNPGQVYTADQTGTMLGGKGVVEEIRAMRADSRAQAKAVVQLQSRFTKLMERWDTNGMPEVRAVA